MSKKHQNPLYFIALLPPENIRAEIENFKVTIKEKFQVEHALKLPAHITLQIPFRASKEQEAVLFQKLAAFSEEIAPFKIDLEDFGRFAKNVIFIKLKDHEPFIQLHSELQKTIRSFINLKSHEIPSKIHPHITIAVRDLKRSNFHPIWNEFEHREYKNSFMSGNLVLLKHNGKTWDIIRTFKLAY
ncbi:2'-5' RNA ligase family protein [Christiangramia forsetii]|uniref:2'-5' RNA ligase n=2 Tax=Christiangramia forsetii TaxID=411153 RepID=A0LZD0_CHRFK|nr:2'-5' RNA ligase family protein [Christiangramia forsetii]GGG38032.1 hypothetical protein GCM10011532_22150 [Christiangramia forsetii]CAL65725.1 conserved hypothetical protein-possible nucleotide phosphodiesterase [Christiangramia forsetii KT0803]